MGSVTLEESSRQLLLSNDQKERGIWILFGWAFLAATVVVAVGAISIVCIPATFVTVGATAPACVAAYVAVGAYAVTAAAGLLVVTFAYVLEIVMDDAVEPRSRLSSPLMLPPPPSPPGRCGVQKFMGYI